MNLLAHAYLSFNEPDILVGNMISDFVKGRKKFDFPLSIRAGITLHREIDSFTDTHRATTYMKGFFRPQYGHYAAPFTDIAYDYFLANDDSVFPDDTSLRAFTLQTYTSLLTNKMWFPPQFEYMFQFMKTQDWLYNYRFHDGIEKSFRGLVQRAKYMNDHVPAMRIFNANQPAMKEVYSEFFPELKKHSREVLANL